MDASSPATASGAAETAEPGRRKSGRVTKKPQLLADQMGLLSKRKRDNDDDDDLAQATNEDNEDNDIEMQDPSGEDDEEDDENEGNDNEPGGGITKGRQKKARTTKPGARKVGPNGDGVDLAIRPAKKSRGPRAKPARISAAQAAGGLYAEVFSGDLSLDDVATEWINKFNKNESTAVSLLFTFLLKCAGCDHQIEDHDVEDPDHFAEKISDIQDEYQAQNITEYPLISKSKGTAAFKQSVTGLMNSIIKGLSISGLLFDNTDLMEVLTAWISTLSSAGNRPFRHTATVASLAIVSALCDIGRDLVESSARTRRQAEGEKKKKGKGVNKGRLSDLQSKVKHGEEREELLKNYINAWFDTVFVHRYRDIDFRIRVDCMQALGEWIMTYPELFFDGSYLRYLGWVLSDAHAHPRLEVVRALIELFKDHDKLSGLRTFTERFRPRMIEMATRDSESSVRSATVELLDVLREAGFLEPDDIDSIGRLIFDSDPRVRKAVVNFFAENVNDVYESRFEDLGGQEALEDVFGSSDSGEDDFDQPRLDWLKLKCLVEILETYDAQDAVEPSQMVQIPGTDSYMLVPNLESRFSLAAEVLCDRIPELKWEVLAGYLLYDHSRTPTQNGTTNGANADSEVSFKQDVKLSEKEEILLLEVLNAAVRLSLSAPATTHDKSIRKPSKTQKLADQEALNSAAQHLMTLIPRLLNKYGAIPDAASAVLRLEHVLKPENQDSTAYVALLEDVRKQFLSHAKPQVLEEASIALLHARTGEVDDLAQGKLTSLTEDTVDKLNVLAKGKDLSVRGSLGTNMLDILESAVLRLEMLARIEDLSEMLEAKPTAAKSNKKDSGPQIPVIDILLSLLHRAIPAAGLDAQTDKTEDNIGLHACRAVGFYFMWKIRALQKHIAATGSVPVSVLEPLAARRDKFVDTITAVLRSRSGAEEIRLIFSGALIDLFVVFGGLWRARRAAAGKKGTGQATDASAANGATDDRAYEALALEIPRKTQSLLLHVLSAAEKAFAKRARKTLEDIDERDAPATDEEPESDEESDDEYRSEEAAESRLAATLVAEQRLCELAGKLVLGIWAGVIDGKLERITDGVTVRRRLRRNKGRLGVNFKGVIEAMERGGPSGTVGRNARGPSKPANTAPSIQKKTIQKSQEALVASSDDEDQENEEDRVERELQRDDEIALSEGGND